VFERGFSSLLWREDSIISKTSGGILRREEIPHPDQRTLIFADHEKNLITGAAIQIESVRVVMFLLR
jgi:hypothetical protein